jgi:cytochrome c oxidase cbb3-type subunit 3
MAVSPILAISRQKSGSGIALYGQRDTDCFSRPFLTLCCCRAKTGPTGAKAAPTAPPISSRRVVFMAHRLRQLTPRAVIKVIGMGASDTRRAILVSASAACSALIVVASAGAQQRALTPVTDTAAVERGEKLLAGQCGFCHGANARGGSGGPDLTRSALVQTDEDGNQLAELLASGRPDKGMPKFDLPRAEVSDLAAFLHSAIYANSNRRLYKILDIVVGDAKAGEAYFNGAGRCSSCHSTSGDLKGVGARYDPVTLQGRLLLPRGHEPAEGSPSVPMYTDPTALQVTVRPPSGVPVSGGLVRLTDFEVTLYDAGAGRMRSWLRTGETPNVLVTDPLQAHVDHLTKWTDADMHNVTAYLAGLK